MDGEQYKEFDEDPAVIQAWRDGDDHEPFALRTTHENYWVHFEHSMAGWVVEIDDDNDDYKELVEDELLVKTVRYWVGGDRAGADTKSEALTVANNLVDLIRRQQVAGDIEIV